MKMLLPNECYSFQHWCWLSFDPRSSSRSWVHIFQGRNIDRLLNKEEVALVSSQNSIVCSSRFLDEDECV